MVSLSKILFATDFSENAENAFNYALYFAKLQHGKLYILHVITKDFSPICLMPAMEVGPVPEMEIQVSPMVEEHEAEIKQKMFEFVQRSRKEGLLVEDILARGKPFSEIIRVSQERQVDLIIMGGHEKSELELMLLGSTIGKVMKKALCPVLIVRQPFSSSGE